MSVATEAVAAFCLAELGSAVAAALFYEPGVGWVAFLEAAVSGLGYGARCEACSEPFATTFPSGSRRDGLARWGEEYLRL